jgi:splicing factor 3B subunit 2
LWLLASPAATHPAGGWGKPPVDEFGTPIYGNVFGTEEEEVDEDEAAVDKVVRWGELESEEEESEEEDEEESEEEEVGRPAACYAISRLRQAHRSGVASAHALVLPPLFLVQDQDQADTESLADGYASVASGLASSLPSGIETPSEIDLRKTSEGPKQLYTVLEQQKASVAAGTLMGSEHTYVMPAASKEKMSIAAQASEWGACMVAAACCRCNRDRDPTTSTFDSDERAQPACYPFLVILLAEAAGGTAPRDAQRC